MRYGGSPISDESTSKHHRNLKAVGRDASNRRNARSFCCAIASSRARVEYSTARYFSSSQLSHILRHSDNPTTPMSIDRSKLNDGDVAVREDIRADPSAMSAFEAMQTADREAPTTSNNFNAPYVPPTWTQTSVQMLFSPVYASVEQHFDAIVGPPNNVRLITSCGRFATTVETKLWPTCPKPLPPIKASALKKHWRSR